MIVIKIRKIGKSLGVILPKAALNRLQATNGDRICLSEEPGGAYLLTTCNPGFKEKAEKVEQISAQYRNTLSALSKR